MNQNMENVAKEKCAAAGQSHLFLYENELTADEKTALYQQIAEADFSVLPSFATRNDHVQKGRIEPIDVMRVAEIEDKKDELTAAGTKVIREGRVAAVLLAGGMGTRLGSDNPKGM